VGRYVSSSAKGIDELDIKSDGTYEYTCKLGSSSDFRNADHWSFRYEGSEYTYKPFGITTATGTNPNRFRFTGRKWDQETGLYYYRARYYDATVGRFVSEDPLGFGGSGPDVP